jgi:hypothetical protein
LQSGIALLASLSGIMPIVTKEVNAAAELALWDAGLCETSGCHNHERGGAHRPRN